MSADEGSDWYDAMPTSSLSGALRDAGLPATLLEFVDPTNEAIQAFARLTPDQQSRFVVIVRQMFDAGASVVLIRTFSNVSVLYVHEWKLRGSDPRRLITDDGQHRVEAGPLRLACSCGTDSCPAVLALLLARDEAR